jgi:glycosyltransferase involved in cell wall biosynthesis
VKIVYIITKADEVGGAQIHVRDLSVAMIKAGHDVCVIVGENGQLVEQLKALRVRVVVIDSLKRNISLIRDLVCISRICKILRTEQPDLISLHSSKAGVIGRISARIENIPCIFTAHGWAFADGVSKGKRLIYSLIEMALAKITSRIITVSYQDEELAYKYHVSDKSKILTIHNGMNKTSGVQLSKHSSFKPDNVFKIISVARFCEQKDHFSLITSLSNLNRSGITRWTLDLIGKGPLMDNIMSLVSELGLSGKVSFLGERNDVDSLLYEYDLFMLISNWEGFPRSILEAMRSGLPVIASNVGGVKEAVKDNRTGFLVPRGDVETLQCKIEYLINNKALCLKFGDAGQQSFMREFTFERMFEKTLGVYNELSGK